MYNCKIATGGPPMQLFMKIPPLQSRELIQLIIIPAIDGGYSKKIAGDLQFREERKPGRRDE